MPKRFLLKNWHLVIPSLKLSLQPGFPNSFWVTGYPWVCTCCSVWIHCFGEAILIQELLGGNYISLRRCNWWIFSHHTFSFSGFLGFFVWLGFFWGVVYLVVGLGFFCCCCCVLIWLGFFTKPKIILNCPEISVFQYMMCFSIWSVFFTVWWSSVYVKYSTSQD